MILKTLIKHSEYYDSATLMLVSRELSRLPKVADASVIMATEANKNILKEAGLLSNEAAVATPNDLVIVIKAEEEAAEAALRMAEQLLKQKGSKSEVGTGSLVIEPKTIHSALRHEPDANFAVISVAGRYAADVAWEALTHGLHVLLFSDNVSLEDEIALKKYAREHGLLLMGPGAGTAIINGVALGFANVVPRGPVGIVSAAGTGLQEVSALLAKQGIGITQGIGTGGRDLQEEVGGIMMLEGLKALQADPDTQVILMVSKPPSPGVAELVMDQVATGNKPTIVSFMGSNPEEFSQVPNAIPTTTLRDGALLAAKAAGAKIDISDDARKRETRRLENQASKLRSKLAPGQRYLRGLFSGGTLCYEAQVIWRDLLREPVLSNAPLNKSHRLSNSNRSVGHTAVDLGEEEFTVGRPHPMIDNDLRIRRLMQEGRDPETAVIMLDVVLGYGAHPDPASELGPAIRKARRLAQSEGRELLVVLSVTGTEQDPQRLSRQTQQLKTAGAIICNSNAEAAILAGMIVATESQDKSPNINV